jgi:hypothetical protein
VRDDELSDEERRRKRLGDVCSGSMFFKNIHVGMILHLRLQVDTNPIPSVWLHCPPPATSPSRVPNRQTCLSSAQKAEGRCRSRTGQTEPESPTLGLSLSVTSHACTCSSARPHCGEAI